MKKWIIAAGTCAALSVLPMSAVAGGYHGGDAVVGGIVGGVVGGIIGSAINPYPVYVAPAPVVVEPYGPPVVVERYAPPVVVYEAPYYRRHHHYWRDRHYRRYWDDDDGYRDHRHDR